MSSGFGEENKKPRVTIYMDEVSKLTKKYKRLKKYMKSPMYEIKTLFGTEDIISDLLKELDDDKTVTDDTKELD